jgi:hypothetical protein
MRTALPLPASPQGEVQAAPTPPHLADSPAEQHERLTALLNLDAPATKDSSNSSDKKADDKSEAEKPYLAAFKEHLRTCWTPPEGQSTGRLRTIFRIALSRDGALVAAPDPVAIEGVASPLAPALVQGARRALSQCQPYSMLPAKDYKDWRTLDVYFTPDRLDVATVSSGAQKSSSR